MMLSFVAAQMLLARGNAGVEAEFEAREQADIEARAVRNAPAQYSRLPAAREQMDPE
jgi:hypothetical protein